MKDHTRTRAVGVAVALAAAALCVGCSDDDESVSLEMRIVQLSPADHLTKMTMTVWGGQWTYYAHDEVLLTEQDVMAATAIEMDGTPAIELTFSSEGREKLLRVTRRYVGSRMGIIINGTLLCAPLIDAPVESGTMVVTGHMLEATAQRCSRALTRKLV